MTDEQASAELERLDREEGPLSDDEQRHLENLLYLRAMVLGWTGDPYQQPATSVLAAYHQMKQERAAGHERVGK